MFSKLIVIFYLLSAASSTPQMLQSLPPKVETLQKTQIPDEVSIDSPTFDFGPIFQGKILTHDFKITNESAAPLTFARIETDCGCSAGIVDKSVIDPSQTAILHATLDPGRLEGDIERKITVHLNHDNTTETFDLLLKAKIESIAIIKPGHVYFKDAIFGKGAEETIIIEPKNEFRFNILKVDVTEGDFETNLEPVFDSSKDEESAPVPVSQHPISWKLKLILPKSAPQGRFLGKFKIFTDSDLQPEIETRVMGFVKGEIAISPTQAYLGNLEAGTEKKKSFNLTKIGEPTLKMPQIESTLKNVTWEIEEKKPGEEFVIRMIYKVPAELKGKVTGELKIKTGDLNQPEILIPIFAYIPAVKSSQE